MVFITSFLVLVLSQYLLDPNNIYRQLEQANAYERIAISLEEQLETATQDLSDTLRDSLDVKAIVKSTINNNLENFLQWLGNETDDWFVYLPIDLLRQQLGEDRLQEVLVDSLTQQIVNKRVCTASEEEQFYILLQVEGIEDIEDGENLGLPDCFPADPRFREKARQLAAEIITGEAQAEPLFDRFLNELGLSATGPTIPVAQLEELLSQNQGSDSRNSNIDLDAIYQFQTYFNYARVLSLVGLILSLLTLLLLATWRGQIVLTYSKMLKSIAISLIFNGIFLMAVLRLSLNQGLELAFENAGVRPNGEVQILVEEIKSGVISYFDVPYLFILSVGIVTLVLLLVFSAVQSIKRKS